MAHTEDINTDYVEKHRRTRDRHRDRARKTFYYFHVYYKITTTFYRLSMPLCRTWAVTFVCEPFSLPHFLSLWFHLLCLHSGPTHLSVKHYVSPFQTCVVRRPFILGCQRRPTHGMPGWIYWTIQASSKICVLLGSVWVGVSEGSYAIGSRCLVCSVSAIVVLTVSAWSMGVGVGSGWGVGSGSSAGSGSPSSSVVDIGAGSGLGGCDAMLVVGVPFEVGSGAGMVDSCSSWAVDIRSCSGGGLESLFGSSTVSIS